MKQKYIDSLLSEIELLSTKVETLKESKRVPFSFFKASFKRTQEISRLLHELEFVQIEEMRGEMEKLVQYLSDAEKTKKEDEAKVQAIAEKPKEVETEHETEKQTELTSKQGASQTTSTNNADSTPIIEKEQEATALITEVKPEEEHPEEKKEDQLDITEQAAIEKPKENAKPAASPSLLTNKSEKVLADIAPKNKSLNDIHPINQTIQDVRRSISLNDQFLFQRELFNNNREAMNAMLAKLQSFSSFDLVESYLKRNTTWDFKNETVDKFLQMLKERY